MTVNVQTAPTRFRDHRPQRAAERRSANTTDDHSTSRPMNASADSPARSDPMETAVAARGLPPGFRLRRFLIGFALSGLGLAVILLIGVSLISVRSLDAELAMPLVGLSVITGVMLVGGGFGLMATSSPAQDDDEFDRLMQGESLSAILEDRRQARSEERPEASAESAPGSTSRSSPGSESKTD